MNTDLAADAKASQQAAITRFFKGSSALYLAFRTASMGQFPHDIAAIEAAFAAQDAAALRRHAHNLKSALNMLGFEAYRQRALTIELAAVEGDLAAAALAWHSLQSGLTQVMGPNQTKG